VRIKSALFIFLVASLLSGCIANEQYVYFPDQKKIVEDPGKGRIYVIGPKMAGVRIAPQISDDGESIGNTRIRGYLCWEQKPGETTISGRTDNISEVTVNVEAGKAIYILQTVNVGWETTHNQLHVVSEQEGREALKACRPPFSYVTNADGAATQ
jgi:hypothetical protein